MREAPEGLPIIEVAVAGGSHDDLMAFFSSSHSTCDALQHSYDTYHTKLR